MRDQMIWKNAKMRKCENPARFSHFRIFPFFQLNLYDLWVMIFMIPSPQQYTNFRSNWHQLKLPLLSTFSKGFNLYDISIMSFKIHSPQRFTNLRRSLPQFKWPLYSLFSKGLIYMICEWWSFHKWVMIFSSYNISIH